MRIVSFLPSATEILFALGLADEVAGVTFECDYPAEARLKAKVVHSHLAPGLPPAEIDAIVRAEGAEGRSLYFVDLPALQALSPDLIVLQDLCRVCAMDSPTLARDMSQLPSRPQVLSLSAHTLEGVFREIELVGEITHRAREAASLTASLRKRVDAVQQRPALPRQPPVLALEWLDPFFQGGHWIPEMILLAGGAPTLAQPGEKSVRLSWEQVGAADPDVIVAMPCGYDLPATVAQYSRVTFPEGWQQLSAVRHGRVYAVDGSAFFSRPGPRLVDGLEILAALLREEPGAYQQIEGVRQAGEPLQGSGTPNVVVP